MSVAPDSLSLFLFGHLPSPCIPLFLIIFSLEPFHLRPQAAVFRGFPGSASSPGYNAAGKWREAIAPSQVKYLSLLPKLLLSDRNTAVRDVASRLPEEL